MTEGGQAALANLRDSEQLATLSSFTEPEASLPYSQKPSLYPP